MSPLSHRQTHPEDRVPALSASLRETAELPLEVIDRRAPQASPSSRRVPGRSALRFIPLALPLIAAGGLIGLYFQPPGLRWAMSTLGLEVGGGSANPIAVPASRPDRIINAADTSAPQHVVGLGRLFPEGEVVTISAPFGAGDARIAEVRVQEGERVEAGTVLAVLDNERPLAAALEAARANLATRQAMLAQTRAATLAAREEAEAALARALSGAENAARDFQRTEELRRRGFAADQTFEQRRTARDEAHREVQRLRATLSRYGGSDLDRQADVVVAQHNVASARAELARAEADMEKAFVRAPTSATVLSIAGRPGERPPASGMMNLGALDRMTVEIEVHQSRIGLVRPGQLVEVASEALPQRLSGRVVRTGLEVGRQGLVDVSPAAHTDARVVKVWAALDGPSTPIAARFVNLQVTARIMSGDTP